MLFLTIILFSLGIVIGIIWYSEKYKPAKPTELEFPSVSSPIVSPAPVADNIDEWQTYRNEEYGFEMSYSKSFYIKENYLSVWNTETNSIITISSNDKFEKEASSLLLSVENIDDFNKIMTESTGDDTKEMVSDNLGLALLKKTLNTEVIGSFAGDPPWDYYLVYIKIPNAQSKGLLLTVRIYQADDPGYGGTNSDLNLSKQILSTFKFIENSIESSSINIDDLLGYWFTPHAATRNITFLKDNQFKFNDGRKVAYIGNYTINGFKVTLKFDDQKMNDIVLKLSKEQNSK